MVVYGVADYRDATFAEERAPVTDAAPGKVKHHAANQITMREDMVGAYLERGFLLRMRGERDGQVNLIWDCPVSVDGYGAWLTRVSVAGFGRCSCS